MASISSDFVNVGFTLYGFSTIFNKENNISEDTANKEDILGFANLIKNMKAETGEPVGFVSIPELVGIDYVGYIIEKERYDKLTKEWIRTDEYKVIGSKAINLKDTRIAYDENYRYRIRSVLKLTLKKKKETETNFDILKDIQGFVAEKVKEDFENSLSLVDNADNLYNKGISLKVSTGEENPEIDIAGKFILSFDKSNNAIITDRETKKEAYVPLAKESTLNANSLLAVSSKIDLQEILNKIVKSKKTEETTEYEYISYYYASNRSKHWAYVDILDQELISPPVFVKIIPDSVNKRISIYWVPAVTFKRNIAFYNLYRRNELGQKWEKIAKNIGRDLLHFVDNNVELHKKYIYSMTTTDKHNIESLLGTQVQAELNSNIAQEKEEKQLKWVSGPGARPEDLFSVFKKWFIRDEQLIARESITITPSVEFNDEKKDFLLRIRSLDTHEMFEIPLTLKNVKEVS